MTLFFFLAVDQLCPTTLRLTNLSQLEVRCGDEKKLGKNVCKCTEHESAENHACGMVFIYTFAGVHCFTFPKTFENLQNAGFHEAFFFGNTRH